MSTMESSLTAVELKASEQSSADAITIYELREKLNAERAKRLELETENAGKCSGAAAA